MMGSRDNRLERGVKWIIGKSKCYSVTWKVSSERYLSRVKDLSEAGFRGNPESWG